MLNVERNLERRDRMTETVIPRKIEKYGWKPSLPDPRDILADTSGISILDEVDPRHDYMTPIYDQLKLGSCTSQAVAAAIDADRIINGEHPIYPSRLWIYALERIIEGSLLTQDTGAYGRDGFKAVTKYGVVPEKTWPYSDRIDFWSKNPMTSTVWSQRHPISRPYKTVPRNLSSMKQVLSNKQTIALGFSVFESFESNAVAQTGIMPHPNVTRERMLGGHEVLMVGYLKKYPDHALMRNSWSQHWGLNGYFLMPWSIVLDPRLSNDFWTIYRPM
jgi:C1A family cysteine protease